MEEIGDLLLSTGKLIQLGNTDFEVQLKEYLNKAQINIIKELASNENTGHLLYGFFGAKNGMPNHLHGEDKVLDIVGGYLATGV